MISAGYKISVDDLYIFVFPLVHTMHTHSRPVLGGQLLSFFNPILFGPGIRGLGGSEMRTGRGWPLGGPAGAPPRGSSLRGAGCA